jgi:ADP-heptose:LPS heptosyltransferase
MIKRILLSRTDGIGDVILTLPLAGFLKHYLPSAEVIFLGTDYTLPVIRHSRNIDQCYSWNTTENFSEKEKVRFLRDMSVDAIVHVFPDREIAACAAKAGIALRIGTTRRIFHLLTCNKTIQLSRRNSDLHEAQLNFMLLQPLGFDAIPVLSTVNKLYGMGSGDIPLWLKKLVSNDRYNIILHPKTKGSAREWGIEKYHDVINMLYGSKYNLFVTGTAADREPINKLLLLNASRVHDLTGKLTLDELVNFIGHTDGLISCSTGPLHIAAALGKAVVGIYPPIKPMDPVRWAPLGKFASFIVAQKECSKCRQSSVCECIDSISAESVVDMLITQIAKYGAYFNKVI